MSEHTPHHNHRADRIDPADPVPIDLTAGDLPASITAGCPARAGASTHPEGHWQFLGRERR
ncbi:hypothetical protein [Micromonospora carbonacea]|uniref:hypothetical protein n=1 Tax=Micromonospora carbonacea TaxID=47853 RepID=UPI003711DF73